MNLIGGREPGLLKFRVAPDLGQLRGAVERHPAHELRRDVVLRFAACLPDAVIGIAPHCRRAFGLGADERPGALWQSLTPPRVKQNGVERRAEDGLDRHRPGKPARHQRRPQLHPRVRHLRAEVRALPRGAEQRRLLPARDRDRAARLPAERAAARAGRRPPRHRPFPPRYHLRRARPGHPRPDHRGGRGEYLAGATHRPPPRHRRALRPTSGSPAAASARGPRATACTRPPSPPA